MSAINKCCMYGAVLLRLPRLRLAASHGPSWEVTLDGRHAGEFKSLVNVKNGGSVTWVFVER